MVSIRVARRCRRTRQQPIGCRRRRRSRVRSRERQSTAARLGERLRRPRHLRRGDSKPTEPRTHVRITRRKYSHPYTIPSPLLPPFPLRISLQPQLLTGIDNFYIQCLRSDSSGRASARGHVRRRLRKRIRPSRLAPQPDIRDRVGFRSVVYCRRRCRSLRGITVIAP